MFPLVFFTHRVWRRFVCLLACLLVLAACQSVSQKDKPTSDCQKNSPHKACISAAQRAGKKATFPRQFSRDPHARHKVKAPGLGLDSEQARVIFSANNLSYKHRNYAHSVIAPQRHAPRVSRYNEQPGMARVRSGNLQFDALFSLAQNTLDKNTSQPFLGKHYHEQAHCACYVLRSARNANKSSDEMSGLAQLALAGDLALAAFDPKRMQTSLEKYLSAYRPGLTKPSGVAGDTDGFQIADFAGEDHVWPLSAERIFWAWPLQSVLFSLPDTARDPLAKKALRALRNTIEIDRTVLFDGGDGLYGGQRDNKNLYENLAYYHALKLSARLAKQQNDVVHSVKYLDWSVDLKNAINQHFWLASAQAYKNNTRHASSQFTPDWSLQALALLLGVPEEKQRRALTHYLPADVQIYSPQTAAYSLRVAHLLSHSALADRAYRVMVDHAALQLGFSQSWHNVLSASDGASPLKNKTSKTHTLMRQHHRLSSAAAYQSMVVHSLFGVQPQERGIAFHPLVSSEFRRTQFDGQAAIALYDLALRGRTFDIKIKLPASQADTGIYRVSSIHANGQRIAQLLHWHEMEKHNSIVITLGALRRDATEYKKFPHTVVFDTPSKPIKPSTVVRIDVADKRFSFVGKRIGKGAGAYLKNWGGPKDSITVRDVVLEAPGRYRFRWQYRHPALRGEKGIAHGVKWLSLSDAQGNVVFEKTVRMPLQPADALSWAYSPGVSVALPAGRYTLRMQDFINMTYLQANMAYTGLGGSKIHNRFDLRTLTIDRY